MGCSINSNVVSFSPQSEIDRWGSTSSLGPSISHPQMSSPMNTVQSTPRVVYPSSHYSSGNPGFYYDLMQNYTHTGSQTNIRTTPMDFVHALTPLPTYIPTQTSLHTPYIPSNPIVYFDNLSPSMPNSNTDTHGMATSVGGLSSTTPQHSNQHIYHQIHYDAPHDNTVDLESQSICLHTEIGQGSFQSFPLEHTSPQDMNVPRSNFHVGCQTRIASPGMEFKEQKKLSLPVIYPQKMSWQKF